MSVPSAPQQSGFEVRWWGPQGHPDALHYKTVVHSHVPALLTRQCSLISSLAREGGWVEGRAGEGGMQRSILKLDVFSSEGEHLSGFGLGTGSCLMIMTGSV